MDSAPADDFIHHQLTSWWCPKQELKTASDRDNSYLLTTSHLSQSSRTLKNFSV